MSKKSSLDYEVSMPFLTGSLLQHGITASGRMVQICFYALSNGQSVATLENLENILEEEVFLCPF